MVLHAGPFGQRVHLPATYITVALTVDIQIGEGRGATFCQTARTKSGGKGKYALLQKPGFWTCMRDHRRLGDPKKSIVDIAEFEVGQRLQWLEKALLDLLPRKSQIHSSRSIANLTSAFHRAGDMMALRNDLWQTKRTCSFGSRWRSPANAQVARTTSQLAAASKPLFKSDLKAATSECATLTVSMGARGKEFG
ncbi:hypothetical protein KCU88_g321, partial [Aureobasidium melanogenum]